MEHAESETQEAGHPARIYGEVSNVRWADAEQTSIVMDVYFYHLDEVVPFCAMPTDYMSYGRELYQRGISGDFGPIAEFDGP